MVFVSLACYLQLLIRLLNFLTDNFPYFVKFLTLQSRLWILAIDTESSCWHNRRRWQHFKNYLCNTSTNFTFGAYFIGICFNFVETMEGCSAFSTVFVSEGRLLVTFWRVDHSLKRPVKRRDFSCGREIEIKFYS